MAISSSLLRIFFLFDLLAEHRPRRAVLGLAATLFLMALQGSFHLMVWTCMLLGLVAVFSGRRALYVIQALLWTGLLCAFRILPSAVSLQGIPLQFHDAYPTLGTFFDGLTAIRHASWMNNELGVGWVDMDCYIGFPALALLLCFGWLGPFRQDALRIRGSAPFYAGIALMVLLSLGPVYRHVFESGLPVLSSQRIPARFNMVIVSAGIVLGALALQRYLEWEGASGAVQWLVALALPVVAYDLYQHQTHWTLREIELWVWEHAYRPVDPVHLLPLNLQDPAERTYAYALWLGSGISLVAMLAWIWRWRATREDASPGFAQRE